MKRFLSFSSVAAGVLSLTGVLASRDAAAQEYPRRAPALDRLAQELFAEILSDQVPYEDLYGTLLNFYQSPLNLNTAGPEELRALPLLAEKQVAALLRYAGFLFHVGPAH